MKRILLVEDDDRLREMLTTFLKTEGYEVTEVADGEQAIALFSEQAPDILLLDMMLPGADGLTILQRVSPLEKVIVIMITAQQDEFLELSALNLGVHDFLTKPLRPHILLAKLKALSRLSAIEVNSEKCITVQDVTLNSEQRSLTLQGIPIETSDAEFDLAHYLMRFAGEVVSREQIIEALRGIDYDGFDRSIDMRISSLRKKLNDIVPPYKYIKTVRTKGYVFSR